MIENDELTHVRERMVEEQIRSRGIKDARVLDAMGTIPRHVFVPSENRHLAMLMPRFP